MTKRGCAFWLKRQCWLVVEESTKVCVQIHRHWHILVDHVVCGTAPDQTTKLKRADQTTKLKRGGSDKPTGYVTGRDGHLLCLAIADGLTTAP